MAKPPLGKGWHTRMKRKPINKASGGWVFGGPEAIKTKEETTDEEVSRPSMLEAAYRGIQKGATANWNDEIEGVQEASGINKLTRTLNPMMQIPAMAVGAGRMLFGDGMKDYESSRDYIRERQKAAEKEHPVTSTVSELGGALLMPTGPMGSMTKSALTGAGYGLASGVGEGEGLKDSIVKGGVGTLVGGVAGAAAPKIGEYIGDAAGWVGDKFQKFTQPVRRTQNPDKEALPYLMEKIKRDVESGKTLSQEELDFARRYGMDIVGGDLGGQEVHSLADWAGRTSPAAKNKMDDFLNARHADESRRLEAGIANLTQAPDARTAKAALKERFDIVNDEAYELAMRQGDNGISSPTIDRIMQNPPKTIQDIVQRAGENFKTLEAAGMTKKGYHVDEEGVKRPTLEFMDQVKKEFDAVIAAAKDAKDNTKVASLTTIKNKMVEELDEAIPDYKRARGIFADYMGVNNAADAGKQIFKMLDNPNLLDQPFMKALNATSSAERGMLASGLLTSMKDMVRTQPDSRLIATRLLKSPQSREVVEKIIGTRKVKELEMMIKLEKVAAQLRNRVQGNSATAARGEMTKMIASELGWASAGAGVGALASGSLFDPWNAFTAGLGTLSKRRVAKSQKAWADKLADYIISGDMKQFRQVAQQMTASPHAQRDVTKTVERLTKIGGSQAPAAAVPLRITVGPRQVPAEEDQE